ncbi:protein unc-13 homolog B-like [Cynoglossus semilaevis]|uniref:protein unc-13 homolog B-like n=1 Tax=Cynoglossus semilaevis TaxID=244447 RepID=UPI000D626B99|nr:protein unc-13 homolog B-like [Cynoglossus semilaevis]
MDDRDSDYRSEASHRPARFYNSPQTNSSVHQYPIADRVQHQPLSRESEPIESYELDCSGIKEPSPPDSSRFESSGNLSPVSSQLTPEPEKCQDPGYGQQGSHHAPLFSQPSTWDEKETEEVEKDLYPQPEPGSNKDFIDSTVILPKPQSNNYDESRTRTR